MPLAEEITTARSRVAYATACDAAIALEETIEYLPHLFRQTRSQTSMCIECRETEWVGNHLEPEDAPEQDPDEVIAEDKFTESIKPADPVTAVIEAGNVVVDEDIQTMVDESRTAARLAEASVEDAAPADDEDDIESLYAATEVKS